MALALALMLAAGAPAHAGDPVLDAFAAFNAHAVYPLPTLDGKQLAELREGKVLKIVHRDPDNAQPARAIALLLTEHDRESLWVASLDPHLTVDPDLVEIKLSDDATDRSVWYGYYDLPFPLADRHWAIEAWNNHELVAATGGAAWEHGWTLTPQNLPLAAAAVRDGRVAGVDEARMESAIFTPDNSGAWIYLRLPDGRNIVGYHAQSTIGGSIPDWLVLQLIHSRLDALLMTVADRCNGTVAEHYTPEHYSLWAGDGTRLTWRPEAKGGKGAASGVSPSGR